MSKLEERINRAISKIEQQFIDNLTDRDSRANELVADADPLARAVGQHLESTSTQRGLLGIAAALRVISAGSKDSDPAFTRGLVHYAANIDRIEARVHPDLRKDDNKLRADTANVIKNAELLYALASMSEATRRAAGATELAENLSKRLLDGRAADGGWSYQISGPRMDALPTAWAVLALSSYGSQKLREADTLYVELRDGNIADPFVRVFVLYVLTFMEASPRTTAELRRELGPLWSATSHILDQDVESNIEYLAFGDHSNYIRVPWQLYMIALTARLSPLLRFSSPAVQARLESMLGSVEKDGRIIYPYSGRYASTRTNSILHEVLRRVNLDLQRWPGKLASAPILPALSRAWHSKKLLWVARSAAFVGVALSLKFWTSDPQSLANVASNVVSTFLLGTLMWRSRK